MIICMNPCICGSAPFCGSATTRACAYEYVYPYAKKLVSDIRRYNPQAKVIFYMTMARRSGDPSNVHISRELGTYQGMQRRVNRSYRTMARENSALVAPVGVVWQRLRTEVPNLELYADNTHPNINGSYLVACVLFKVMFRENSARLPAPDGVTRQSAQTIQSITDMMVP